LYQTRVILYGRARRKSIVADIRYHTIVSDLHFGDQGAHEDFVYGQDFRAFLEHTRGQGATRGGKSEVIIAGDFMDFLQIAPLRRGPWREAKDKIERVAKAHRETFDALARFAKDGNRVVILAGNHDIELSFREVQEAFKEQVGGGDEEVKKNLLFPNDEPLGPQFRGWERGPFAYRLPGVYIEHGNQLDALNFFDHRDFFEASSPERIKLPWGSEFVLDLFNEVEAKYRFIDKLRPRNAAVLILWLLDPALVKERLPTLAGLGGRLYPELRRYARAAETPVGAGARGGDDVEEGTEAQFLAWLGESAADLETIDKNRGALVDDAAGSRGYFSDKLSAAYAAVCRRALTALTSRADTPTDDDGYVKGALEIAGREKAEVVILGHTHGIKDIREGAARYLNTGTWIGLLDLDLKSLENAETDEYRAVLEKLRNQEAFAPVKLISFADVSYPGGKLEANVKVFKDGKAEGIAAG
jgi:UDP-2,3-diacylglucosamine pyrophosphatase LpxH